MEAIERCGLARGSEKGRDRQVRTGYLEGSETICIPWWTRVIKHLSRPIEHTTPKVNPGVNYGLGVIVMCQHHPFINGTNVPLSCRTLVEGDACGCRGHLGFFCDS